MGVSLNWTSTVGTCTCTCICRLDNVGILINWTFLDLDTLTLVNNTHKCVSIIS